MRFQYLHESICRQSGENFDTWYLLIHLYAMHIWKGYVYQEIVSSLLMSPKTSKKISYQIIWFWMFDTSKVWHWHNLFTFQYSCCSWFSLYPLALQIQRICYYYFSNVLVLIILSLLMNKTCKEVPFELILLFLLIRSKYLK